VLTWGVFTAVRYRQRLLTGLMGRLQRVVGSPDRVRVLIVGAGEAGQLLAWQIKTYAEYRNYELVGFVDDDQRKLGLRVRSAQVLGDCSAIPQLVKERYVGLIIIAIHSIAGAQLRDMLSECLRTNAQIKILPNFLGTIDQVRGALPLKDIRPEDLLGRQLCPVDDGACSRLIAGKVVLVTGAAGSIGSELCRQVLALRPLRLLMLDNNETGLHDLHTALHSGDSPQLLTLIADVADSGRLEKLFAQHRPQVVFHAAAYKHVPMMELHPAEAVRVNIQGTQVVAMLAAKYAAGRFVLISTDKAVRPSSIMGATKRVAELLVSSANQQQVAVSRSSLFTAVRFGNVLGSRGSVVPTFTRQIDQGGPVTVTHPEMTRYFISISEAVSLIIQAATLTEGGDIFMLDMGESIRIEELAHKMIRLRGLRPGQDIQIVHSGIRPGEKLHEELLGPAERRLPTTHPKIYRIKGALRVVPFLIAEQVDYLLDLARQAQHSEMLDALWRLVQEIPLASPHPDASLPPTYDRRPEVALVPARPVVDRAGR
jgi:FlaA1/EpsC-like NDP-sugar epimerase